MVRNKYKYRPGQPNWEYKMWKFQDFSATQILREISVGHFKAPKTAILTIGAALNLNFWKNFTLENVKNIRKKKS